MIPSSEREPERYVGRPLLVILENYVLHTIGELPSEAVTRVGVLVRQVFGGGDDWRLTIRNMLQLPDSIDSDIREEWQKKYGELDIVQFAKWYTDRHWVGLIDPIQ